MAKMSFEEWMKAREEYASYISDEKEPAAPAKPSEPEPAEPEPAAPAAEPEGPDYKEELAEIKSQLAIMAKALSPALGDVQPVGIDDVVTRFFKED